VAIVAATARAYVDLNRDEREIDPEILAARPMPGALIVSPKVTGGLGVVPSRIATGGAVWKRPLPPEALEARLAGVHRPYHAAIAAAMDEAQAAHGVAILIDCHSMPPLARRGVAPQIVIGDRHGRSAGLRFTEAATDAARRAGLMVARNHPYAGGHTLDRHGWPRGGRHAIQIEIDRTLYLDAAQRSPGPGLTRLRQVVAAIAAALGDEARGHALAAE
jgi:N-formylglutamate amidohydrolase